MTQRARVRLDLRDLLPSLKQYLSAASLVFARTWGKILAYAYCARQAALLGVRAWLGWTEPPPLSLLPFLAAPIVRALALR